MNELSQQAKSILMQLKVAGIVPIKIIDLDNDSPIFNDLIEFYLAKTNEYLLELVISGNTISLVKINISGKSHIYFKTSNLDSSSINLIRDTLSLGGEMVSTGD